MTPRQVLPFRIAQAEHTAADAAFYRMVSKVRARQRRHMRRKAFLRWLFSREVRIAIAVILLGLVFALHVFAAQAPRDRAPAPAARDLSFRSVAEAGRFGTVAPDAVTSPGRRERTPGSSDTAKLLTIFWLLSLSLVILIPSAVWAWYQFARAADKASEGRVVEGRLRRALW